MRTLDIKTRLKEQVPSLKTVEIGAGFLALQNGSVKQSPSAFVLPSGESAKGSALNPNAVRQHIDVAFSVLLAFKGAKPTGGKSVDDYEDIRDEIKNALIGWKPPEASISITYMSARPMGFRPKDNTAWFEIKFKTQTIYQKLGGS